MSDMKYTEIDRLTSHTKTAKPKPKRRWTVAHWVKRVVGRLLCLHRYRTICRWLIGSKWDVTNQRSIRFYRATQRCEKCGKSRKLVEPRIS